MPNDKERDQELKIKLNKETAKINWQELQRFYASGSVIAVSADMDLIEVASQFSVDNSSAVSSWLEAGSVYKVDDKQAGLWFEQETEFWAVVVAPWVLIQECSNG